MKNKIILILLIIVLILILCKYNKKNCIKKYDYYEYFNNCKINKCKDSNYKYFNNCIDINSFK